MCEEMDGTSALVIDVEPSQCAVVVPAAAEEDAGFASNEGGCDDSDGSPAVSEGGENVEPPSPAVVGAAAVGQATAKTASSPERKFHCNQCGKAFSLMNVLRVHQRIHTGERPYTCNYCGRTFNQSGSLNRHKQTHTRRLLSAQQQQQQQQHEQEQAEEVADSATPEEKVSSPRESPKAAPQAEQQLQTVKLEPLQQQQPQQQQHPQPPQAPPVFLNLTAHNALMSMAAAAAAASAAAAALPGGPCPVGVGGGRELDSEEAIRLRQQEHYLASIANLVASQQQQQQLQHTQARFILPMVLPPQQQVQDLAVPTLLGPASVAPGSCLIRFENGPFAAVRLSRGAGATDLSSRPSDEEQPLCLVMSPSNAVKRQVSSDLGVPDSGHDEAPRPSGSSASSSSAPADEDMMLPHGCSMCRKRFLLAEQLAEHLPFHDTPDGKKCSACGKELNCASALRIHFRKHSGERPFICRDCGRAFSQNGTLKRHRAACAGGNTQTAATAPAVTTAPALPVKFKQEEKEEEENLKAVSSVAVGKENSPASAQPAPPPSPASAMVQPTSNGKRRLSSVISSSASSGHHAIDDICARLAKRRAEVAACIETQAVGSVPAEDLLQYLQRTGQVHKCPDCQVLFTDADMYRLHMSQHDSGQGAPAFKCSRCDFIAKDRLEFGMHFAKH